MYVIPTQQLPFQTNSVNQRPHNKEVHSATSDITTDQITQDIVLADICEGLVSGIDLLSQTSNEKAIAFASNSNTIFEGLNQAIHTNRNQSASVDNDGNHTILTFTQNDSDLAVQMNDEQIIIKNETLLTLRDKFCKDIQQNYEKFNPDLVAKADSILRSNGYFQIYNKLYLNSIGSPSFKNNQPYMLPGNGTLPQNLNGAAYITAQDGLKLRLVCRHLVVLFILDSWKNKQNLKKINLTSFNTIQSIVERTPLNVEALFKALFEHANHVDFLNNTDFGQHLKFCFEDMQKPEKNQTSRELILLSTQHVMAIRLRIKYKEDKPVYKIEFYDPNNSDTLVHCKVDQLADLESHTLAHYINGTKPEQQGNYHLYYGGGDPISVIIDCNEDSFSSDLINTKNNKKLANLNSTPLSPTLIHFLLVGNFSHNLAALSDQLQEIGERSPDELFRLLSAKNKNGASGFFRALQEGNVEAIRMFKKLLMLLPEDKRAEIIAAKDKNGTQGIYYVYQNGDAKTLSAFGELLDLISDENLRAELIAAKSNDGTPGVTIAFQKNHAQLIAVFGQLLQSFSQNKRAELIAAKRPNGIPGIFSALSNGHVQAIKEFGNLLKLITNENKLAELIAAKKQDGTPSVFIAIQKHHQPAVKAYYELPKLISKINIRSRLLSTLIP